VESSKAIRSLNILLGCKNMWSNLFHYADKERDENDLRIAMEQAGRVA
jgi:hypothetical protein